MKNKKPIRNYITSFLLLAFISISNFAFAQSDYVSSADANQFEEYKKSTLHEMCNPTDIYTKTYSNIIGDPCVTNYAMGKEIQPTVFQIMAGKFNIPVQLFMGVLLIVGVLSGGVKIASTADKHAKPMLSKIMKFPIIIVLLMPAPIVGYYSAIQQIVVSSGGAGLAWGTITASETMDLKAKGVPMLVELTPPPQIVEHNLKMTQLMFCAYSINDIVASTNPIATYVNDDGTRGKIYPGEDFDKALNARRIDFGYTQGKIKNCGPIIFPEKETEIWAKLKNNMSDYEYDSLILAKEETKKSYLSQLNLLSKLASLVITEGSEFNLRSASQIIAEMQTVHEDGYPNSLNAYDTAAKIYFNYISSFSNDIQAKMQLVSVSANEGTQAYIDNFKTNTNLANFVSQMMKSNAVGVNANRLFNQSLPTMELNQLTCPATLENDGNMYGSGKASDYMIEKICDVNKRIMDVTAVANQLHKRALDLNSFGDVSSENGDLITVLANDPSCAAGTCDASELKKAPGAIVQKFLVNFFAAMSFNDHDANKIDGFKLIDPFIFMADMGEGALNTMFALFALDLVMSGIKEGVANSIAATVGFGAVSGVLGPIILVCRIITAIFAGMAVTLMWVIPFSMMLSFMLQMISWFVDIIKMLFAMPINIARQVVDEGEGIQGRRMEITIMMFVRAFFKPTLLVYGVIAYYTVIPYFFTVYLYEVNLMASTQSGFMASTVSQFMIVVVTVSLWTRLNLHMITTLLQLPEMVEQTISSGWQMASNVMDGSEMSQSMSRTGQQGVDSVNKTISSGLKKASSKAGKMKPKQPK